MRLILDLTPTQFNLLTALVREESILGRLGEKRRATSILEKLERAEK